MDKKKKDIRLDDIQVELRQIIGDAIGADISDVADDFPLLGYVNSSLTLVEGLRGVHERFGVVISIRRVMEAEATIESLAVAIHDELTATAAETYTEEASVNQESSQTHNIPLAPSQSHLAFLLRYSSGASAAFNESLLLRLEGPMDLGRLEASIARLAATYQALHVTLSERADCLDLHPGRPLHLVVSKCVEDEMIKRSSTIVKMPFEPGELLFRAELIQVSTEDHILILVGHALVLERESLATVLRELATMYQHSDDASIGGALQLEAYNARARNRAGDQLKKVAEDHWKAEFRGGVPSLEIPSDRQRPPVKDYSGARLNFMLGQELSDYIERYASDHGLTQSAILFTSYTVFLHRLSRQDTIVVGAASGPIHVDSEGESVVARTRNMVPVRSTYEPSRRFRDYVVEQASKLANTFYYGRVSLAELIQILDLPRNRSRSPLFSAGFRSESLGRPPSFGSLHTSYIDSPSAGSRYDIELIACLTGEGTQLILEYSKELFDETTVRRWMKGIVELLRSAIANDEEACGDLPVTSSEDRFRLLDELNDTTTSYPSDKTTLSLFLEQVAVHPDRAAVRFDGQTTSYKDLSRRVDEIASLLHAHGVDHGDRVAVLLERSTDLIASLLATWRIGATYVPLDPIFPKNRLLYMMSDSEVQAILISRQTVDFVEQSFRLRVIAIDECYEAMRLQGVRCVSSDSAYIIYTSGSTGNPKGVEVSHDSLVNLLLGTKEMIGFRESNTLLALTTVTFDISAVELFLPLVSGGTVELGEDDLVSDGMRLAERIESVKPNFVQATPSTWKYVLSTGWIGDRDLTILSTGEAISRNLAEKLLVRSWALWNLYGPTETTVFSTLVKISSAPGEPITIGRPYPNTRIYILDERLQLMPIGAVGELYIGGDGVARGYWQRDKLTAECFIESPFRPGERIYRTGDLARYLPSGEILCLGRVDQQVKIHGIRVEIGEVEAALRDIEDIDDAVVTSWSDTRGDTQLVAHILSHRVGCPSSATIRAKLRKRLPDPMIPPYILYTSGFPKTVNGKILRSKLPSPDIIDRDPIAGSSVPATETERLLADSWSELLKIDIDRIGRDSDFMDLGGHSLLMTQLIFDVYKQFDIRFSMREFFEASTLQSFAALIEKRQREKSRTSHNPRLPNTRGSEWAKQRMAYLRREAELPANIQPARGLRYQPQEQIRSTLLTGSTGFLGVYLVAQALRDTNVQLFCMVRPRNAVNGKARIEEQMRRYDVWCEDTAWQTAWNDRVQVVEGDVTLPRLGMEDSTYESLARELDSVIHSAAQVNFIYPYEALRATNVYGLHEVIRFAFHGRIKPLHHLSTAAIWPMGTAGTFYEDDSIDHGMALNLGYDEAKWVGEKCLLNAADRGLPVSRYRPGEIGGDSRTGRSVLDHFLIACIKGFLQFGAFPTIDCKLDIAPVDYVAKAVVYLALQHNTVAQAFHLTNPECCTIVDALDFLHGQGYRFEQMRFEELRKRLIYSSEFSSNALFPYQAALEEMNTTSLELPTYDTALAQKALVNSGIYCPPVDERLLTTYLSYLRGVGYLPEPTEIAVA